MDLDVGIMFEGVWKNQPDVTVTVIDGLGCRGNSRAVQGLTEYLMEAKGFRKIPAPPILILTNVTL